MAEFNDNSSNKDDDEMRLIKNDITNILRLHDDEVKNQVIDDLLSNGRQSLAKYRDDIPPKIYAIEMNSADGKLIGLLKKYFHQQWKRQFGLSNQWFVSFLEKYQDEQNRDLYERILTRTAEFGSKYMKDYPILSIVLQFLFEFMDDECLKNTNTFNDLWLTVTNEGLKSITKYSNYIHDEVMKKELDRNQSALFLALREYYRSQLVSIFKQNNIPDEQSLYDLALDHLAEDGLSTGIQEIQQELTSKSDQALLETPPSDRSVMLTDNTYSTAASTEETQVQNPIIERKIKVFFKQTSETVDVPVSSASTIKDVIKYVCEMSVRKGEIDYNDYYLFLAKSQEILDDERTLEETNVFSIENPEFRLHMKTSIKQQIMTLALQKLHHNKKIDDSQTKVNDESPADCVQDANSSKTISRNALTSESLETVKSNLTPDSSAVSLPIKVTSLDKSRAILAKEDLANNYQNLQKKIRAISEMITRDPVLRQKIVEKFNEINIVVCGSSRVGKSTLINAICQQKLAKTNPGLNSCTNIISPYYLKEKVTIEDETIKYQYNIWDTPGFESWGQEDIHANFQHIKQKPKSDILCMIYCASPGSFANLHQLELLIKECISQHIFCALVCTNKWSGFKEQRDAVMRDLQQTLEKCLEKCDVKPQEENGVIYFGNIGLCTSVNSLTIKDEDNGREYEQSGINELILGIMKSLDDEKLAQWCMVAFENKPFWKSVSEPIEQIKKLWNRLIYGT